jgi:hypothetical protein
MIFSCPHYITCHTLFQDAKQALTEVITQKNQYGAYKNKNKPYRDCMDYLNNRDGSNKVIEELIGNVMPIYHYYDGNEKHDLSLGAEIYYKGGYSAKYKNDKLLESYRIAKINNHSFHRFKKRNFIKK